MDALHPSARETVADAFDGRVVSEIDFPLVDRVDEFRTNIIRGTASRGRAVDALVKIEAHPVQSFAGLLLKARVADALFAAGYADLGRFIESSALRDLYGLERQILGDEPQIAGGAFVRFAPAVGGGRKSRERARTKR